MVKKYVANIHIVNAEVVQRVMKEAMKGFKADLQGSFDRASHCHVKGMTDITEVRSNIVYFYGPNDDKLKRKFGQMRGDNEGDNNLPDDSIYETPSDCSYSSAAPEKQSGRGTTTMNHEVAPPSCVCALYKKFGEEDNGHMDASTAQKIRFAHSSCTLLTFDTWCNRQSDIVYKVHIC
ncbi:PREDICTED: uncharacterized protein LOC101309711 [Fragaria vesca subsp. vesca]|uniref:uncharacterized protein LOC101309711 n=1 Tax=Fragaria vesca subsp. vesca TaxID=101020 RepID=UPI0002C2DD3F|nr:PREDICTED: uncharacterized protein LOC101309711 [Fragaria vesca subsp. vesca]XP_011460753.1 PREDICTED: uncharacterized protein LOC101309711 [Fragaria vesca subsp. vesca]